VFLDLGRIITFSRVVRRVATTYGRVRPDLAPGCPERIDVGFLRFVWTWPERERPHTLEKLSRYQGRGGRIVHVTSPQQVAAFVTAVRQAAVDACDGSGLVVPAQTMLPPSAQIAVR